MIKIALAGVKHSGKSTIGRLIAQKYGVKSYDLDDLILKTLPLGTTIRSFFRQNGKDAFQKKEISCLQSFEQQHRADKTLLCLSLGGASLENSGVLDHLKENGWQIIGLHNSEDVLFERIMRNGIPPFLDANDPKASFSKLYNTRSNTIKKESSTVVDLNNLSPQEALAEVLKEIK